MSSDRWKQVNAIVSDLIEQQPEDQDAFLGQVCGNDSELRREVKSVLASKAGRGESLTDPVSLSGETREEELPLKTGQMVSHYRILGKIAEGSMGQVYRGEDTRLNRPVALKFLPGKLAEDRQSLERFKREARAASGLNHPNICTIYDVGEHEGQPFIVMEYLDGETLVHRIKNGPIPPSRLIHFAIQIAEALQAAHSQGILHRDIKPANVLVMMNDHVKLLDFGLAKLVRQMPASSTHQSLEAPLTAVGMAVGTPYYMSPEQLLDQELDGRSDIFSLGVLLYEMATGILPFRGRDLPAVFHAIVNKPHELATQFTPDLPEALEEVINQFLQKDRGSRYQSTEELLSDLKRLQWELGSVTPVPDKPAVQSEKPGQLTTGSAEKEKTFHPLWWVVHQVNVLAFYGLMVFAVWNVKEWTPGIGGLALLYGVMACTALNGTLRAHLMFVARFNRSIIADEMLRVAFVLRGCDGMLSLLLLLSGLVISSSHNMVAGILAAVAIGYAIVFMVVEPVTTRAAFSNHPGIDH